MKPLTRKEQFLNYISGKTTSKPKPMTREEKILDEFKPVMVVNVTFSPAAKTCSFDKTLAEISDHYDNGGSVQFYFPSGYVGYMTDYVSNFMLGVTFFMSTGVSGENLYSAIRCVLNDDNTTRLDIYSLGPEVD